MSLVLDHLVVAARTLEEGARWLEERTGVPTVPGGRHALMGTHNRLMSLGAGAYLEIIAIDPQSPSPARPRWFGLDSPAMRRRLSEGPALIHWVARTDDIDRARASAPDRVGEVLTLSRGEFRWRIGVAPDGALPAGGAFPTLIQWEGDRHPAAVLPESGCRLERLTVRGPGAGGYAALLRQFGFDESDRVQVVEGGHAGLSAVLRTARGVVLLPESAGAE